MIEVNWAPYVHIDDPDKRPTLPSRLYWLDTPDGVIIGRFVGHYALPSGKSLITDTGFVVLTSGRGVPRSLRNYAPLEFPTAP